MLIEFRVQNFRSFHGEQTLSLVAGTGTERPENVVSGGPAGGLDLLKSAVVYGANASGKSNLISAVSFFARFVRESAEKQQAGDRIAVSPFLLDKSAPDKPTTLEMTFLLDGIRHQYGFSVTAEEVVEEWLIVYPRKAPQRWFERGPHVGDGTGIKFSPYLKGEKIRLFESTRPNALFLSVAAKWNHPQLTGVFHAIQFKLRHIFRDVPQNLTAYTTDKLRSNTSFRAWLTRFLRNGDLGIHSVSTRPMTPDDLGLDSAPPEIRKRLLEDLTEQSPHVPLITHISPYSGHTAEFDLEDESEGTQRLFQLLGPWRDVLENGWTLFVDELDSSMHPLMTRQLIQSFHNPETNRKGAQLVFTTHDTSLLTPTIFRRDQVWFTEKDDSGATRLYSLQEYRPRKNEAFEKGYLAGRYGAVPYLADLEF